MSSITQPEASFELGGERFVIDLSPTNRRASDDEAFTVVKGKNYVKFYEELAKTFKPNSVLELGIFQGGSFVLFDKIFSPMRMAAVDISETPIPPLERYVASHDHRHIHLGVSQSDEEALKAIVADDLGGELDLVIDDASHTYKHTKRSFEILFPLLRPKGLYIIEDWAWGHHPRYQASDAPLARGPALSTLIFEQIALLGSTADIEEIQIRKPLYVIKKGPLGRTGHADVWDGMLTRGKGIAPL